MNIDRFKNHHIEILSGIAALRKLAHRGVSDYAVDIAQELRALSQVVTQHLAIEDRILYPSLERSGDARMARMSRAYQNDMQGIASAFIHFARRWSNVSLLQKNPDGFRSEANTVLKNVHQRMVRENHEFYPTIESL
ncbi:hemerythrin domain-containing protein [Castellaniella hirudinis]|uniref:hemerythrin domain-containing protein n=1 Tax=Castellaniella hirudinis TaxID=1144617 RepID=UPI0039C31ACF